MNWPRERGDGARRSWLYLLISGVVLAYVAACVPNWTQVLRADAWEHHRAVRVLALNPWDPGNPTYDTESPSIRYSPYSLAMAMLARLTGGDPFELLCAAAVVNTALFLLGLYALLWSFSEERAAAAILVVALVLWGRPPGYANSYALADLPWHQVNPSAFAMGLVLVLWAMMRMAARRGRYAGIAVPAVLTASIATLSHPMTGVFGLGGLICMVVASPRRELWKLLAWSIAIAVVSLLLCSVWPWFPFLEAATSRRDAEFWFNSDVLAGMLTTWCAPALLLSFAVIGYRREPLVRFCLVGAAGCFALALASFAIKSPTLARLPMPAMIFLHIPIGLFVYRTRLLDPRSWPARLRSVWEGGAGGGSVLEAIAGVALVYLLVPQLVMIAIEPHLARPYIAPWIRAVNRQRDVRLEYDRVLAGIEEHDVVLAERVTAWPVGSTRGRIVAALHFELFEPNQARRHADVRRFFGEADLESRREILDRYRVKWILVDVGETEAALREELLLPGSEAARQGRLALLDASKWLEAAERRARSQRRAREVSVEAARGSVVRSRATH